MVTKDLQGVMGLNIKIKTGIMLTFLLVHASFSMFLIHLVASNRSTAILEGWKSRTLHVIQSIGCFPYRNKKKMFNKNYAAKNQLMTKKGLGLSTYSGA